MNLISDKVKRLPAYIFSAFQKKRKLLEEKGIDVIDLGIGAPDLAPPDFIIDALIKEAKVQTNHQYSPYVGCEQFRNAVAHFYKSNYGVQLDPDTEVLTLIGSKEGIVNVVQAVINPGDTVLVPDPGYPVYKTAVELSGGKSVHLPLDKENGFTPLFSAIEEPTLKKTKLAFLNYPSNPTSATIHLDTFKQAIEFAKKNEILLAHDSAYNLVTFDDYQSPSILQVENAKEHTIELGSLSKSFNMTGWRIGYAVGNKEVIQALASLKSNIDTSQFLPIQKAAALALKSDLSAVKANNKIYKERMELLYDALKEMGFTLEKPRGTIFLWVRVPNKYTSLSFANLLLEQSGIIVTPGSAFGEEGEGFIRIALTVNKNRLHEVIGRLKQLDF